MYETRRQTLLSPSAFLRRLLEHAAAALLLIGGSLALGMAGLYALYAGLVFVAVAAIVLAPVVHRVLHRFHLDKG